MNYCKDCRYKRGFFEFYYVCFSPQNGIDVLTGKNSVYSCRFSRSSRKLCGVDGLFFKPKKRLFC